LISFIGKSIADNHVLTNAFDVIFNNNFGYNLKFMLIFERHNEIKYIFKFRIYFSKFCKENMIFIIRFSLK